MRPEFTSLEYLPFWAGPEPYPLAKCFVEWPDEVPVSFYLPDLSGLCAKSACVNARGLLLGGAAMSWGQNASGAFVPSLNDRLSEAVVLSGGGYVDRTARFFFKGTAYAIEPSDSKSWCLSFYEARGTDSRLTRREALGADRGFVDTVLVSGEGSTVCIDQVSMNFLDVSLPSGDLNLQSVTAGRSQIAVKTLTLNSHVDLSEGPASSVSCETLRFLWRPDACTLQALRLSLVRVERLDATSVLLPIIPTTCCAAPSGIEGVSFWFCGGCQTRTRKA